MKTSLGYKETMCSPCAPSKEGEQKEYFPTLYVRSEEKLKLPDGEFTFTCRGKVVSRTERSESRDENSKDSCSYEIEVYDIATKDGARDEEPVQESLKSALRKRMNREEE